MPLSLSNPSYPKLPTAWLSALETSEELAARWQENPRVPKASMGYEALPHRSCCRVTPQNFTGYPTEEKKTQPKPSYVLLHEKRFLKAC